MYQQAELFDENCTTVGNDKCFFKNIESSGLAYDSVDIGDITFKGGLAESIHRWYRLTPSFSPSLVRYFMEEFQVNNNDVVFDPFSGRGTTIIECQKHGIRSFGIEINPTLQQSGNLSLFWEKNNDELFSIYIENLLERFEKFKNKDIEEAVNKLGTRIPIIHNVFRWWKKDVLRNLIIARELSSKSEYDKIYKYLWLALNKASIDCANIHRNHPTITFDDNHSRHIDVFSEIEFNLNNIRNDLASLTDEQISYSQLNNIYLGNSTDPLELYRSKNITKVITSPPYPNRFSYIHQTRPQLHFMELIDNIKEATEIDMNAIGGTWGRATSVLQKEIIEIPDELKEIFCYFDELKGKSTLMCNYATKYFLDLRTHIQELKKIVPTNFQGAYVVGNSRLSGVEIFTETILAKMFEIEGFTVEKIVSFRKRGGKKKLYESAVCVRI